MNDSLHDLCKLADDDAVWRELTISCFLFLYIKDLEVLEICYTFAP